MALLRLVTFFLVFYAYDASFSYGFRKFLFNMYGLDVQLNLTRLDFKERGSFGGGSRSFSAKTK